MSGTPDPRIIGAYRLEELVGKGGMGEVYRARHTRLDTERAVKLLPPGLAAEPDFLRRFEREASSAARLEHPNILPVYEYGESGGAPYLVMPYVRGGTLKERLARATSPSASCSTCSARPPTRSITPTSRASSTATSSPPTSSSTGAGASTSPTSASPRRWKGPRG